MNDNDMVVFRNKKTGKRIKLNPSIESDMIDDFRKNKEFKELMKL